MRKIFFCTIALLFLFTALVFADRNAIQEAIGAYEAVVIEAETIAEKPLIGTDDFAALEEKAGAITPKLQGIENEKEWAIQDAIRLAGLNARFNQALTTIAQKLIQF